MMRCTNSGRETQRIYQLQNREVEVGMGVGSLQREVVLGCSQHQVRKLQLMLHTLLLAKG